MKGPASRNRSSRASSSASTRSARAGSASASIPGLGLSISKQIVEGLRGTISAENRRDAEGTIKGARFVVRLPTA